ncbi:hypothetical protein GCM10009548_02420 [Streptomyces malaysiensis subsp. malaysiensis]|uniref:Uncharacterized protein n=1 Tax=Streptomyces malaysiensis TaxID=92644 RepID=A0ABX6W7D2_STRMQ|nr:MULTISPECIES: hypothetical protein [Streptomyces]QPI56301.1 hypothetical protein I1A49_16355 [Streptomyces solisilvae]UHH17785.1 hypothetical protein LUV23_16475 [Streptomyces sp. HNM0561]
MNALVMDIIREIGIEECIANMEAVAAKKGDESAPVVEDVAPEIEILTPEGPDQEGDGYYVTVRDGDRAGLLLGPYATQGEALNNLDRARSFVLDNVPYSVFYAYGTCRVRGYGRKLSPGRLNERIGL